jgi:rhodanese-related sulfurtransferase
MAPLDLSASAGTLGYALLFGAIGLGFGAALEMGGFGDTRKLAGQFYFKDMTVLKVMFTGIIVAAVLLALATSFGLLDMSRVWVNPTYLWPGIVGGLIMGVGFILGGFCPGTSLVAAATLKIDGIIFLAGAVFGVYVFGETVSSFEPFFLSSSMGRFTLPEWLGLPLGVTVLLVVVMALLMFWGAEILERHFGQGEPWSALSPLPGGKARLVGAGALVAASLVLVAHGQPTPAQKFDLLGASARRPVEERAIFVDPAEVVALRTDLNLQVRILDLRNEHDFNLFHVGGSRRLDPASLSRPEVWKPLLEQPASTVTFLVGHGEAGPLASWKTLRALGASNLYVVEGGIERWLERYPVPECVATRSATPAGTTEGHAYRFAYATGSSLPAAWPELSASRSFRSPCEVLVSSGAGHQPAGHGGIVWPSYTFTRKVKLQSKAAVKGGCG